MPGRPHREGIHRLAVVSLVVCLVGATLVGLAAPGPQVAYVREEKVPPEENPDRREFGDSVDADGDLVVVGSPEVATSDGTARTGKAFVYERDEPGRWSLEAELAPPPGSGEDWFGESVGIDNETVVVGAPYDSNANGDRAGAAYVFSRGTDGEWTRTKLLAADGEKYDQFGISVALVSGTAVVGAWKEDQPDGYSAGAAYVFNRTAEDGWTQETKLTQPQREDNHYFGYSVDVREGRALVGAPGTDRAYLFARGEASWTLETRLFSNDTNEGWGADYGSSVALGERIAVVGAPDDDNENGNAAGSAYVFEQYGDSWLKRDQFTSSSSGEWSGFGSALSIDGHTLAVGEHEPRYSKEEPGDVYIFQRNSSGLWEQEAELNATDESGRDSFGESLHIENAHLVVGADEAPGPDGNRTGAVYSYADLLYGVSSPVEVEENMLTTQAKRHAP